MPLPSDPQVTVSAELHTYPVPAMDVLAVPCPDCKAEKGAGCTAIFDGAPVEKPHAKRYARAAEDARNG